MDRDIEIKWIHISTRICNDTKIKLIEAMPEGYKIFNVWVKLLALAGETNMDGCVFAKENIPYTDEDFALMFNHPIDIIKLAFKVFVSKKFGMIKFDNNGILQIANWDKHQNIEGLGKIREGNRLRQQRFRDVHPKIQHVETEIKHVEKKKEVPVPKPQEKTKKYYELFFEKTTKNIDRIPKLVLPKLRNTISKAVEVLTQAQYESVLDRCVKSKGTEQSWEYYLNSVWRETGKVESAKYKSEPPVVGKILSDMANGKK